MEKKQCAYPYTFIAGQKHDIMKLNDVNTFEIQFSILCHYTVLKTLFPTSISLNSTYAYIRIHVVKLTFIDDWVLRIDLSSRNCRRSRQLPQWRGLTYNAFIFKLQNNDFVIPRALLTFTHMVHGCLNKISGHDPIFVVTSIYLNTFSET